MNLFGQKDESPIYFRNGNPDSSRRIITGPGGLSIAIVLSDPVRSVETISQRSEIISLTLLFLASTHHVSARLSKTSGSARSRRLGVLNRVQKAGSVLRGSSSLSDL